MLKKALSKHLHEIQTRIWLLASILIIHIMGKTTAYQSLTCRLFVACGAKSSQNIFENSKKSQK